MTMLEKAEQNLPHKHTAGKYSITLAEVYFGWTSVKLKLVFWSTEYFCLIAAW